MQKINDKILCSTYFYCL